MVAYTLDPTQEPVIGRTYLVPCVQGSSQFVRNPWFPVLGTAHEDREIIGFPDVHFHYDFRFISEYQANLLMTGSNRSHLLGTLEMSALIPALMNAVFLAKEGPTPVLKPKKCVRALSVFPSTVPEKSGGQGKPIAFIQKLEEAYQSARVDCGKCPHRGMDLRGVPADAEGRKVCPLHGLRWDQEGKLAPRVLRQ